MKHIAILGAGKSTWYLYDYLNRYAEENNWAISACDRDLETVQKHTAGMHHVSAIQLDVSDNLALRNLVGTADLVVSMLPAFMHPGIASICVECNTHLATASYESDAMKELEPEIVKRGLIFINEAGLDPGIDHMSAMRMIHQLKSEGCNILSFESYCGGLTDAASCAGNPWQYKFSWNPMNVITAGQGGHSVFKKEGQLRYIPSHRVFQESTTVDVGGESYDAYPNRDSVKYMEIYGLGEAQTYIRGTLRRAKFCAAWQMLVAYGFTDNQQIMPDTIDNPARLTSALTGWNQNGPFADWLISQGFKEELKEHFRFLDLENTTFRFHPSSNTAAMKLCEWLQTKWQLEENDRDEVIMIHKIKYAKGTGVHTVNSILKLMGENQLHTAMAKTVGLPLAIAVERILKDHTLKPGLHLPITADWYQYILPKLETEGILFAENQL